VKAVATYLVVLNHSRNISIHGRNFPQFQLRCRGLRVCRWTWVRICVASEIAAHISCNVAWHWGFEMVDLNALRWLVRYIWDYKHLSLVHVWLKVKWGPRIENRGQWWTIGLKTGGQCTQSSERQCNIRPAVSASLSQYPVGGWIGNKRSRNVGFLTISISRQTLFRDHHCYYNGPWIRVLPPNRLLWS